MAKPILHIRQRGKQCTGCRKHKLLAEFYKNASGLLGTTTQCKECIKTAYRTRLPIEKPLGGEKQCSRCKVIKPFSEFYKSKAAGDGATSACRQCLYQHKTGRIHRKIDKPAIAARRARIAEESRIREAIWRREKIKQGVCVRCGKEPVELRLVLGSWTGKRRCPTCISKHRSEEKAKRQADWARIFEMYGRICACCGESDERFLTIDHMNNDGSKERKVYAANGRDKKLARYAARRREDIQILCYNCNCAKERCRGVCPHKIVAEGETWNMLAA